MRGGRGCLEEYSLIINRNILNAVENRDVERLRKVGLDDALCQCLAAHWSGNYQDATALYDALDLEGLSPEEKALAESDRTLLKAKRGESLPVIDIGNVSVFGVSSAVYTYATFSRAFWIDHREAWKALWRLLYLSVRMGWLNLGLMTVFLMGHLLAIRGVRKVGFMVARHGYRRLMRRASRNKTLFTTNIAIATFPYTHVVARKLGDEFDESAVAGEQWLTKEPYYQALLFVSGLYGYAYGGDVSRAEVYANELHTIHETGQLVRYLPLSWVMPLLPLALRGYGHAIEDEFDSVTASFQEEASDALICSQFYRASAVISLCLGRCQKAQVFITKAAMYRAKTGSFHAWEEFDEKIKRRAEEGRGFSPGDVPLFVLEGPSAASIGASQLLGKIISAFVQYVGVSDESLERYLADMIAEGVDCSRYSLIDHDPSESLGKPFIKIGARFCVFAAPAGRGVPLRRQLAAIDPVLRMLFAARLSQRRAAEAENLEHMAQEIFQVAHDIKSPLTALAVLSSNLEELASEKRRVLTLAIDKINTISQDLLRRHREYRDGRYTRAVEPALAQVETVHLASSIEKVVREKKLELGGRAIEIAVSISPADSILCTEVNQNHFERSLANVIQNAFQAIKGQGCVHVAMRQSGAWAEVSVMDDGRGIPAHIVEHLGKPGFSHGKEGGSGLGLYHASSCFESWKGRLSIDSTEGIGTKVVMALPALTSSSMVCDITVPDGSTIVSVDDDGSIGQTLLNMTVGKDRAFVSLQNLYDLDDYRVKRGGGARDLYLIDCDFGDGGQSGLDWIIDHKLQAQAVLVTSKWREKAIWSRCEQNGVRFLPKEALNARVLRWRD